MFGNKFAVDAAIFWFGADVTGDITIPLLIPIKHPPAAVNDPIDTSLLFELDEVETDPDATNRERVDFKRFVSAWPVCVLLLKLFSDNWLLLDELLVRLSESILHAEFDESKSCITLWFDGYMEDLKLLVGVVVPVTEAVVPLGVAFLLPSATSTPPPPAADIWFLRVFEGMIIALWQLLTDSIVDALLNATGDDTTVGDGEDATTTVVDSKLIEVDEWEEADEAQDDDDDDEDEDDDDDDDEKDEGDDDDDSPKCDDKAIGVGQLLEIRVAVGDVWTPVDVTSRNMVALELLEGLSVIADSAGGEADKEDTDIGDGNVDEIIETAEELDPWLLTKFGLLFLELVVEAGVSLGGIFDSAAVTVAISIISVADGGACGAGAGSDAGAGVGTVTAEPEAAGTDAFRLTTLPALDRDRPTPRPLGRTVGAAGDAVVDGDGGDGTWATGKTDAAAAEDLETAANDRLRDDWIFWEADDAAARYDDVILREVAAADVFPDGWKLAPVVLEPDEVLAVDFPTSLSFDEESCKAAEEIVPETTAKECRMSEWWWTLMCDSRPGALRIALQILHIDTTRACVFGAMP